ncbi:LPS export ABC transporter periplasmic protein LptC [Formicincola oecophyllae]|uniref:LPS export ABC transporter periplasmic protein LptC n=1 Tax=Formicincola oecophyllae TaxID=2558361 RepID=A0A4Y6UBX8_9PROT|nr:LPS export ABC transporter periplasmic protein LptC [Formicincola oecophyllae]QDH13901.1 LPS export ABC transporter periplasmic protein LptC [Formicincola oecophyllae]
MTSPQREDFDPAHQERIRRLDELRQEALARNRSVPTASALAKRQERLKLLLITLPVIGGLFVGSILAWPEITHLLHQNKAVLHELGRLKLETGLMDRMVYRNVDDDGRPYTLTADHAHQLADNRINLQNPAADIVLGPHSWAWVRADRGVYMEHERTLNLDGHIILYRNDGLILNTPSADLDLGHGVLATHDWVHAESPSGTQDAMGAFLDQKANILLFGGPGLTRRFDDNGDPSPYLSKPVPKPAAEENHGR